MPALRWRTVTAGISFGCTKRVREGRIFLHALRRLLPGDTRQPRARSNIARSLDSDFCL